MNVINKNCILFFIKYPEPGKVKTRIASSIGNKQASILYKNFIIDLLSTLRTIKADIWICFSPKDYKNKVQKLLGTSYVYMAQEGHDLGERMAYCFDQAFQKQYNKIILMGSDSPDLPKYIIEESFINLQKNQAVIGPAHDGGYYLIGFNKNDYTDKVFENIKWSSHKVFADTIQFFNKNHYTVYQMPAWYDIDTIHDVKKLYANNLKTAFNHSKTFLYIKNQKKDFFYDSFK